MKTAHSFPQSYHKSTARLTTLFNYLSSSIKYEVRQFSTTADNQIMVVVEVPYNHQHHHHQQHHRHHHRHHHHQHHHQHHHNHHHHHRRQRHCQRHRRQ
eukprot:5900804-Amphidinium_carterae.1